MKHFIFIFLFLTACSNGSGSKNSNSDNGNGGESAPLSQDFPILTITTAGGAPVTSKEVYVNGHVSLNPNGSSAAFALEADMKIKGRGNSTWGLPKKPYRIKLNSKASVAGMPAEKDWVLLANYSDKTLMRNYLALELGRRLGLSWTPRTQVIEVVLNGTELGTYLLTEHIKVAPDRVHITPPKATDTTPEAVNAGYLLELDGRLDEVINWRTARNVPYTLKDPEEAPAEQVAFIKNYLQTAEDVLNSAGFADPTNGYAKYIDIDSFIDCFIVQEVFKNQDGAAFSSIFLYKDKDTKLKMGPLWDFDIGAGNVNYSDAQHPEGWWVRAHSPWFSKLFQDPVFAAKVKTRWNEVKAQKVDSLLVLMDQMAWALDKTQQKNFTIWPILNTYVWPNPVITGSYAGEVAYTKNWLKTRIQWMDSQLNP